MKTIHLLLLFAFTLLSTTYADSTNSSTEKGSARDKQKSFQQTRMLDEASGVGVILTSRETRRVDPDAKKQKVKIKDAAGTHDLDDFKARLEEKSKKPKKEK